MSEVMLFFVFVMNFLFSVVNGYSSHESSEKVYRKLCGTHIQYLYNLMNKLFIESIKYYYNLNFGHVSIMFYR